MSRAYLFLFFLICLNFSYSQIISYSDFNLAQSGNKVLLNWTIDAGSTCNGIDIQRNNGANDFETIGHISGVCGNAGYATKYSFTDDCPVKNSNNHYRLVLSSSQITEVISIEFIFIGEDNYVIKYNEISKEVRVFFKNNSNVASTLKVFNSSGKLEFKENGLTNLFILDGARLSNSLYYFELSSENQKQVIQGSFLVY